MFLSIVMGFLAGLSTLVIAYVAPLSAFDYFFQNPLVSILPRIFIGITPYLVYIGINKLLKFKGAENVSAIIAGAVGAITNTILVITALYIIYSTSVVTMYT